MHRTMKIVVLVVTTFVVGALCEETCVPGTTFMEDCNRCRCSDDGQKACTRKMCPPPEPSDEVHLQTNGQVCAPNEIKMQECNRCRCANNGIGWFCTKRSCPPREKRALATASESQCTPGTNFKSEDGCNSCFCTETGQAACTLKACLPMDAVVAHLSRERRAAPSEEPKCTPGTTFKSNDGCNTCFCSSEGYPACTLMACVTGVEAQPFKREISDNMARSDVAPGTPGFSCTPGSSFKYQCNTCLCSDDGKQAGCSYKFCVPGEW